MTYFSRIADIELQRRLSSMGAVLIKGPKWCGKTTTAEQQSKSVLRLQDPDRREDNLATANITPSILLRGATPRLIDEWQDAPLLWDAVRMEVDRRGEPGQFILTGSNAVEQSKIMHSGTGRISHLKMLPMSLWESKESNGSISLRYLFDNPDTDIESVSDMEIRDIVFAACRGGWPATVKNLSRNSKLLIARDYVESICSIDMSRLDNKKTNPKLTRAILQTYSRNISTLAKTSSLLADITASENIDCSRPTLDDYISSLERLFVIMNLNSWNPAIRSKTAMRSSPKRCFCDPSIVAASLGLTPEILEVQLNTFGFIFEQLCIRDLRAYTQNLYFSDLSYYHDRTGLEADVVLHLGDGRYALIECKLGSRDIDDGARHLLEMKRLIDEHDKNTPQQPITPPTLLVVLTGGQYAYRRKDGVYVVPVACLKD